MTIDKIILGQFRIHAIREGFFYLDGGAMFGVVPKTLWEKKSPADSRNRIKLGLNSLLIQTPKHTILVETGMGTQLDPKFYDFYSVEPDPGLLPSLQRLGFRAEDIDFVINTHLHFDHCGGNTYKNNRGEFVPTFPEAAHIIQEGEWENAVHPNLRDRPSYLKQNFVPLEKHGVLRLVQGDTTISEGVDVVLAPGHTAWHQCVKIHSGNKVLFYLGDMVPTSAHVGLSYIMSYDTLPLVTLENKVKYFEQAVEKDWVLAFNHDPVHFFGKVQKKQDKYVFAPLE